VLSGGIDRRDAMQVLMKNSSGRVRFNMLPWYSRGGFGGARRIGIRAVTVVG